MIIRRFDHNLIMSKTFSRILCKLSLHAQFLNVIMKRSFEMFILKMKTVCRSI